jgi:hypothetical protein
LRCAWPKQCADRARRSGYISDVKPRASATNDGVADIMPAQIIGAIEKSERLA